MLKGLELFGYFKSFVYLCSVETITNKFNQLKKEIWKMGKIDKKIPKTARVVAIPSRVIERGKEKIQLYKIYPMR